MYRGNLQLYTFCVYLLVYTNNQRNRELTECLSEDVNRRNLGYYVYVKFQSACMKRRDLGQEVNGKYSVCL